MLFRVPTEQKYSLFGRCFHFCRWCESLQIILQLRHNKSTKDVPLSRWLGSQSRYRATTQTIISAYLTNNKQLRRQNDLREDGIACHFPRLINEPEGQAVQQHSKNDVMRQAKYTWMHSNREVVNHTNKRCLVFTMWLLVCTFRNNGCRRGTLFTFIEGHSRHIPTFRQLILIAQSSAELKLNPHSQRNSLQEFSLWSDFPKKLSSKISSIYSIYPRRKQHSRRISLHQLFIWCCIELLIIATGSCCRNLEFHTSIN